MIEKINVMRLPVLLVLCAMTVGGFGQQLSSGVSPAPYGFIQNRGQVRDQNGAPNDAVKFILLRPGLNVQVTNTGFSYDTYIEERHERKSPGFRHERATATVNYHRVDISFPGSNPSVEIVPLGKSEDPINYIGEASTTAHHYSAILFRNLYEDIDLKLYTSEKGVFEYDFIVRPGADAEAIRLAYEGQNRIVAAGGKAIGIMVRHGELREEIPASYLATSRKDVDVRFQLDNQHSVSFAVADYDKSQTLIIDPQPNLLWATYYGGTGEDAIEAISTDASNNVYAAGYTYSSNGSNIIATAGTHQSATLNVGPDGFYAIFNSSGVRQIGVYYGGPGEDYILGIVPDGSGNVYLAGTTTSGSGISTGGVFQNTYGGAGLDDAFCARFNNLGARTWATYFGSNAHDDAYDIFLNNVGNPVIVGHTASTTASTPPFAMSTGQTTYGGGSSDAFVATFVAATGAGSTPRSYFGGTGTDIAYKAMRDGSNNIYLAGETNTTSGLATVHQTTHGGLEDGFVAKLSGTTGAKTWMTYYGGTGSDKAHSIDVDASGNAYVAGYTESNSNIATGGAHKTTLNASGFYDGFIAKFNTSGARQWGTYFGGEGDEELFGISEASGTTVFITGYTYSTSGIATAGSYQQTIGGDADAVVARFDVNGVQQWASYFGGLGSEEALRNAIDAGGNFIAVGRTYSSTGIALGGHQNSIGGDMDGFVAKFENGTLPASPPTIASFTPASGVVGATVTLTGTNFETTPANNIVYFGSTRAVVLAPGSNATTLNVTVPNGGVHRPISVTTTTGLTAYSAKPFVTTVANVATLSLNTFAPRNDISGYNQPYGVVAGDFDNDGTSDLAIANRNNTTINVVRNVSTSGNISFASTLPFTTGGNPLHPVTADLDGDGKLDLVTVQDNNTVSMLRNISSGPGNINFATKVDFAPTNPSVVAVEDLDGDGKPDIVVTNYNAAQVAVYRNTSTIGAISMSGATTFTTGTQPYGVGIADIDGDGKKDIVNANFSSGTISVLRNTSSVGVMSFATHVQFVAPDAWMLSLGDFDNNGKIDIAVTSLNQSKVSVFPNTSLTASITMGARIDLSTGNSPSGIVIDDIDLDGKVDMVVSNAGSNTVSVFKNNSTSGALAFTTKFDFATGTSPTYVMALVDLDGDQKKDLALTNAVGNSFSTFRNNSPVVDPEPAEQPSNFAATPAPTTISVSFNAAAITPAGYIALRGIAIPDTDPVDGVAYSLGAAVGNATVVHIGSPTSFNDTGLTPSSVYNYKIYSYNGSGALINYRQVNPLLGSTGTTSGGASEPGANPSAFVATPSTNSIQVSFTAPGEIVAGYIVLRATAVPNTDPVDGITYTVTGSLGNATVVHLGTPISFNDTGLAGTTTYHYKIYAFNGSGAAINYRQLSPLQGSSTTVVAEPPANPTAFVGTPSTNSISVSFTATAVPPTGYIALRSTGVPDTDPVDGATYTVSGTLGNATVVHLGSPTSFNDTGLTSGTTYNYKIYTFNGSGASINYRQASPLTGNSTTTGGTSEPTAQPTAFVATQATTQLSVSFTAASGTPTGYIALRGTSVPNADPVDGTTYTVGGSLGNATVVHVAAGTSFNDTGLASATGYFYKIYSYNGSGVSINYRTTSPLQGSSTTLATEPTVQPTAFVSTPTSSTIAVSFTAPVTPPSGYIALRGAAIPNTDPVDGTTYTVSGVLGNAVVVHIGSGTSFTDTGLSSSTTYNYKVYAYNGSGASINYRQASPLPGNAATTAVTEPTAQPTGFSATPTFSAVVVSFTASSPASEGYIALRGTTVPNLDPVDGTALAMGASHGNAVVVHIGSGTTFNDTGLTSSTTYNYKIYSFNGSGSTINYRQTGPLQGNAITGSGGATEPTAQPTTFSATPSSTSIAVSFAAGAGASGHIAIRSTSVPNTDPVDGIAYALGASLGNGVVAFVGSGISFNDSGLTASTLYNYKIYSFNGTGASINYRTTSPLQGNSTTTAGGVTEPTAQPTLLTVSNQTNSTLQISFTAATGSPAGYIAIRALTNPPAFVPVDGTAYTTSQPVGTGETVAFTGSGTSFIDTGLASNSTYVYRIYSFNGSGATINYLTTSPLQGNGQTTTTSSVPPSSFGTVTVPTAADILTVRYVSATTAIAGGSGSVILKTIDGGSTWVSVTNPGPTSRAIWNVFFNSATTGFAVGTDGLMMRTSDTGGTWTIANSSVTQDLYATHFPATNTGFSVGKAGTVIKTTDGGTNWSIVASAAALTDSYFNTVYFKDVNEGFIAGPDGIFRTINGGTSWTSVSSEAILWLVFPTSTVGFGVGESGTILKTINGGTSWTEQSTPTFETLWSAHFVDQNNGFAVGDAGTALKTTNGGTSWQTTLAGADETQTIYAVHFGSFTNGVAVGAEGFIGKAQTELPAPVVTPNFKTEVNANGATSIGFSIPTADVSRIQSVELHNIAITNEAKGLVETVSAVTTQSGGIYSINLTDNGTEKIGYHYYFVINYDPEFNRTITTADTHAYIKWSGANELKLTNLRVGTNPNDYQLISLPLVLTSPSVSSVFSDDLGSYDESVWRLWSVTGNETTTTNTEKKSGNMEIGKGYWLITTLNKDISLGDGLAVDAKVDDLFKFNFVTKGFYLIGNPYNFAVPWAAGGSVKSLKYWTGSSWTESQTLEPYKGYFIDVEITGEYPVPLTGAFDGGRARGFQFEQNASSWELDIDLTQGDFKNELGKIGMHPQATLGLDVPDERVFPMPDFTQLPSLSIDRPEAGFKLEKDIVPPGANQTWEFTLHEKGDSRPVTMSWDKELIAAIGRELYLFDEEQIVLIDMQSVNSHQTQSNTRLKIITGDPAFVKSEVSFANTKIGTVYPNPAAGSFYVPVAMSRAGEVTVRIFDIQGREIATQVHFAGEGLQNLSVSGLPDHMNGLYVVSTESLDSGRKVQKVIFR